MKLKLQTYGTVALVVVLALLAILFLNNTEPVGAGAGHGSHLQIATTTAVGPDEVVTLFDSNTTCRARVISTNANSALMITFGEPNNGDFASTTLSGSLGTWQAASTTVVYSSDDVGCGQWNAYAYSSTTIAVNEF